MKVMKSLAVLAMSGALATGVGAAALAGTQKPHEGSDWNYGVEWVGNRAFSDYHHNDRCHGSTVTTVVGTVRSVDTRAGETSRASKWTWGNLFLYHHPSYHYRVC